MARHVRRPGRKIDFKQWSNAPGLIQQIAATGTFLSGSLSFLAPGTILRVRGYVAAFFDATMQVDDRMVLTFGLGIFSTDAVALGATAVPDPADEPQYPWLWWKEFRLDSKTTTGLTGGWGIAAQRYEVDTKAMRKVKPGESLVMVFQSTNLAGAPATDIDVGQLRVLIGT